jgi:DNA repair exonuclease SbcCD ATPase subunit
MARSVRLSPPLLRRVNSEFEKTLVSIEGFMGMLPDNSNSAFCQGSVLTSTLHRLEREYEDLMANLKSTLRSLSKREKVARRGLRSVPALPTFDREALARLELDIDGALQALNKTDLEEMEAMTREEEAELDALERRNRERRRRRELLGKKPVTVRSLANTAGGTRNVKMDLTKASVGKVVSMEDVSRQIHELSEAVIQRKAELRRKRSEIQSLVQSHLEVRSAMEVDLQRKERRIRALESKLAEVEKLRSAIEHMGERIINQTTELSRLAWRREQLARQNFTVTRDRHSNSEAVKRLEKVKKVYQENSQKFQEKKAILKQREVDLDKEKCEIDRQAESVRQFELKVCEMEDRIARMGASFSGTLGQSQHELDALNLLASVRMSASRTVTLENELSIALQEGASEEDPLQQLDD